MSREEKAGVDCGDCSHCLICGCDRDDHFEPDPYDMGNAELDAAGHLNHCGDCAQCFGPEFPEDVGEKDNSDLDRDQQTASLLPLPRRHM